MALFRNGEAQSASKLIAAIYEAALDPSKWREFVELIPHEAPGVEPVFYLADTKTAIMDELLLSRDWSGEFLRDYLAYFNTVNPWVPCLVSAPEVGEPFVGESFLPDGALKRTEFWNDFFRKYWDGAGVIGVVNYRDAHSFSALGLHYGQRRSDRDERALSRLAAQLSPHIARAFEISRKLQHGAARRASIEQMLERLSTAALVVNARFQVRYANKTAQDMFRTGVLSLDGQKCLATGNRTAETKGLREAIAAAARHKVREPTAMKLTRGGGVETMPLLVRVMPLAGGIDGNGDVASPVPRFALDDEVLVLITDPNAELALSFRNLENLFQVTAAEAKLARAIAQGSSLKDYAGAAGLSEETVRSQLKSVFAKTNTHRQAELVALLARLTDAIRFSD